MYNKDMKKTIITGFIAILLLAAPAFAETATITPAPKDTKDTPADTKPTEVVLTKKQKIEADLRDTAAKLKAVIGRTQVLIDLLTKNGKDTTDAQASLVSAQNALDDANAAIDQFAGIVTPVKTDVKDDTVAPLNKTVLKTKEVLPLKDPLKKAQDSLKDSKTALITSISTLKDLLTPKDSSN
jgi:hypothetical protein